MTILVNETVRTVRLIFKPRSSRLGASARLIGEPPGLGGKLSTSCLRLAWSCRADCRFTAQVCPRELAVEFWIGQHRGIDRRAQSSRDRLERSRGIYLRLHPCARARAMHGRCGTSRHGNGPSHLPRDSSRPGLQLAVDVRVKCDLISKSLLERPTPSSRKTCLPVRSHRRHAETPPDLGDAIVAHRRCG